MGQTLRSVGGILAGAVGAVIGAASGNGPLGFAIGSALFSLIFPPKNKLNTPSGPSNRGDQTTAVNTPVWTIYGTYERVGAELLRVGKDSSGKRSGIEEVTRSKKQGGGSGVGDVAVAETVSYLHCSVCPCAGFTYIDRIIETNSKDGEKVVFDRFNSLPLADADELRTLLADLAENENDLVACAPIQMDLEAFYIAHGAKQGIQFTPVWGSVSGQLIAELSSTISMYFGSYEQDTDPTEETWHPEGVSADRGKVKIVFNRYGPLEAGTEFKWLLRSHTPPNRRAIIKDRLMLAGIPETRINLISIDPDATDDGWFVNDREPARKLAEEVAGVSFHDLHFMPTEDGLCFTDISRANPTYIPLAYDELGAYENNGGGGQIPSIVNNNIQTPNQKPREVSVDFSDLNANYKESNAISMWSSAHGSPVSIKLRCAAGLQKIQDFADVSMGELQAAEGTETITLMPSRSEVACGCVLVKPEPTEENPNAYRLLRVMSQSVSPETILTCTCIPYDPAVYGRARTVDIVPEEPPTVIIYGVPFVEFIDNVSIDDDMANQATMLAFVGVPDGAFRGAIVTTNSGAFADFAMAQKGTYGETTDDYDFTIDDTYGFDYATTLSISLDNGTLVSQTEDDARHNCQILYLGSTYLRFVTATPTGVGTYELTGLMPAIFGSDNILSIPSGSRVVLITDENGNLQSNVDKVYWNRSKLNRAISYDVTSAADLTKTDSDTVNLAGISLKALSPSPDVSKEDDGSEGYLLRFYARTRYPDSVDAHVHGGFPMIYSDPLSFTVKLYDGVSLVNTRVVTPLVSDPLGRVTVPYLESDLIDYFGSVPDTLSGEIYENGTYGAGFSRVFDGI